MTRRASLSIAARFCRAPAWGFIVGGAYGIGRNTWLNLRWLSPNAIDGPPLPIDVVRLDVKLDAYACACDIVHARQAFGAMFPASTWWRSAMGSDRASALCSSVARASCRPLVLPTNAIPECACARALSPSPWCRAPTGGATPGPSGCASIALQCESCGEISTTTM